ncbi:hypothetical protein J3D48_004314 [Pseudomonas fluorescens]|uniref:hypothetical protein n=1 Tax=Pseudomonas fluorescens TaxID=294 RepID=UPI0020A06EEF|nr:hypothetical protein [Pseudomonas fluorescens]MCP1488001.1 hypothetical protein [Pseudomonas fluorescens]
MKLYKDPQGCVFAYELDGSQDLIIPDNQEPITEDEAEALRNPPPSDAQLWAEYQARAQTGLDRTDSVALSCWKASVPFPHDWQVYTSALRDIVKAGSGDPHQPLPEAPLPPADV